MKYLITIILFCCSLVMVGQKERSFIREGIALYKEGKYAEANKKYDEALKINPTSVEAKFNKADALYQLKKYEDAQKLYQQVADLSADKNIKAKAYHNMGNTFLKTEKYQESVDAYKKSLRLNPNDKDTKYNLSYAKNKLKQQNDKNKNDQNKNDKNKDDKNQNKDNKPGDDKKKNEEQNKKENEGKDGDPKKQEDQKKTQPQKAKISKEQADQILKSLEGEEKKLQQRLLLQKTKVKKHKVDKDW